MFTNPFPVIIFTFIAVVISLTRSVSAGIPKISAVGAKFFTEDGDQFFIKGDPLAVFWLSFLCSSLFLGVAYQLISLDPLIDEDQCKRDAKQMKDLGANTIRVYHVDSTVDHKGCMNAFADMGIYLFVDLDTFTTQIAQVGIDNV